MTKRIIKNHNDVTPAKRRFVGKDKDEDLDAIMTGTSANDDSKLVTHKTDEANERPPIPVTILSGFLGAGKTTLLRHVLTSKEHGLKIAVIVNDFAELNIDGEAIQMMEHRRGDATSSSSAVVKTRKEVITLENGCICCTLRGDLIREINRIANDAAGFDYVLIESTGIAEPQQVAESFCVDPETQKLAGNDTEMLWNAARLDTCVTVVDAVNFPEYMSSLHRFKEVFPHDGIDESNANDEEGEKSISELMVEQVEFANVVLINKADLVSEETIRTTEKLIKTLNPKAKVLTVSYGKIDPIEILNTTLFDMDEAQESPGWLLSLKDGMNASVGEADEYGVSSFVYRSRMPFHPLRLYTFLKQLFCFAEDWNSGISTSSGADNNTVPQYRDLQKNLIRSKGTCWIAGRDEHLIEWHQTGRIMQLNPTASWFCVKKESEWDVADDEEDRMIKAKFRDVDKEGKSIVCPHGDRRQELVFIGTNLQQSIIEDELKLCQLTDEEMSSHCVDSAFGTYPDPILPILIPCIGLRTLFLIARNGQSQHLRIYPKFSLTLQNISLHVNHDDKDTGFKIKVVKVWLDKSDDIPRGLLLATLRPETCEQRTMSLTLLPCDVKDGERDTNRRIRVEVIPSKMDQGKQPSATDLMMCCEVHIMGKVEPIMYDEGEPDVDDDDEEKTRPCDDGYCED